MNLRFLALAALLSSSAHAQLFQTVQTTTSQAVLKGFAVQGKTLQKGSTKLTLDEAGGYVYGVQIEAKTPEDLARAMAGAWGMPESGIAKLASALASPRLMAEARAGFQDFSDESKSDLFALNLSGTGAAQVWKAYLAVQIWPDSAFPATNNVWGDPKAPTVLRVFSDFQCPYCQQMAEETLPTWKKNSAQYRLIHYHFPLPFHKNAFPAAEAGECAARQGKFWPYADQLFAGLVSWKALTGAALTTKFEDYAKKVGLNAAQFKTCLSQHATKAVVDAQMKAGTDVGVPGTPTVYLNGIRLRDYTDPSELKAAQAITQAIPSAQSVIQTRLNALR